MRNRTAAILDAVPDEASFRWLSPEEFTALSSTEKDVYLYRVFAVVERKPDPRSGAQQDAPEPNERSCS